MVSHVFFMVSHGFPSYCKWSSRNAGISIIRWTHQMFHQLLRMWRIGCESLGHFPGETTTTSMYPTWLWLLHGHGFLMALIEIDGLPFLKMHGGSFQFAKCECHIQMVDVYPVIRLVSKTSFQSCFGIMIPNLFLLEIAGSLWSEDLRALRGQRSRPSFDVEITHYNCYSLVPPTNKNY